MPMPSRNATVSSATATPCSSIAPKAPSEVARMDAAAHLVEVVVAARELRGKRLVRRVVDAGALEIVGGTEEERADPAQSLRMPARVGVHRLPPEAIVGAPGAVRDRDPGALQRLHHRAAVAGDDDRIAGSHDQVFGAPLLGD